MFLWYRSTVIICAVLIFAMGITPVFGAGTEYNVSPNAVHFPQNKQNEAPMAVNPTDSNNIITGANDEIGEPDCTSATDGSSNCPFDPTVDTTGVYRTTDGGATWNQQILNWFPQAGLTSDGDPVVAFGPKPVISDGKVTGFSYSNGARAYFGSLAGSPTFGPVKELLAVSYSDDKGATWGTPVVATTRDNPVNFNDKITIWVDQNPNSPFFGNVYVSWTLFTGNPTGNFGEANVFSPEPIMFARSTDGGQTFERPVKLSPAFNTFPVGGRQGSVIRTGPDGSLYVFWDGSLNLRSAILGARSTDGGVHFSRPFLVAFKSDVPSPFPGASFRVNSFPMADVDQSAGVAGKIFVVWADYTFGKTSGHSIVKMVTSSNGGKTWSTPKTAADVSGRSAFYPTVAINPVDGSKIFIGFNAIDDKPFGTAPGAGVVSYDAYYVLSTNGGTTFTIPGKISASSSDPDASSTNSLSAQFLGDYNGASASSVTAWFSWTDSRNGATCSSVDIFRAGGTKPNIYDSCGSNFGNTDIFVAKVPWQ